MESLLLWLQCLRYKFRWLHHFWGIYMVYDSVFIFSAKVSPSISGEQASEISELEDILEEETETAHAAKSSPKVAKLKVPRK